MMTPLHHWYHQLFVIIMIVISHYICCRVLTLLHIDIAFDILCVDNASDDLAPVKTTTCNFIHRQHFFMFHVDCNECCIVLLESQAVWVLSIHGLCQLLGTIFQDCRHSNIVAYFGSYLRKDKLWICMEYCGGGSLQVAPIYQTNQKSEYNLCQIAGHLSHYGSSEWEADCIHVSGNTPGPRIPPCHASSQVR